MADESKVDIDALATFAQRMADVLKSYGNSMSPALSKIGAASPGLCGTNEAQTFRDWNNQEILESCSKFAPDSTHGFESLMYSAVITAANYRQGDLSQAAALDDVQNAFNPAAGTPSVASEQAQADADQRKLEHNLPPEDRSPQNGLPPPEIVDSPTPPGQQSPFEQVREHNDKYGKDEHWRPPDPNAAPPEDDPVIVGPGEI